jgi:hypothetical protein
MPPGQTPSPSPGSVAAATPGNARRFGRVRCQHVRCSLGDVVNLSASGLSARCRGRPAYAVNEPIVVTVEGLDGPFDLPSRVVWVRREGFRRFEVGVAFMAVSDAARRALSALGRAAASNEVLGPAARGDAA